MYKHILSIGQQCNGMNICSFILIAFGNFIAKRKIRMKTRAVFPETVSTV